MFGRAWPPAGGSPPAARGGDEPPSLRRLRESLSNLERLERQRGELRDRYEGPGAAAARRWPREPLEERGPGPSPLVRCPSPPPVARPPERFQEPVALPLGWAQSPPRSGGVEPSASPLAAASWPPEPMALPAAPAPPPWTAPSADPQTPAPAPPAASAPAPQHAAPSAPRAAAVLSDAAALDAALTLALDQSQDQLEEMRRQCDECAQRVADREAEILRLASQLEDAEAERRAALEERRRAEERAEAERRGRAEDRRRETEERRREAEEAQRLRREHRQAADEAAALRAEAQGLRSAVEERRREAEEAQRLRREHRQAVEEAADLRAEAQGLRSAAEERCQALERLAGEQRQRLELLEDLGGRSSCLGEALHACLRERAAVLRFLADALQQQQALVFDPPVAARTAAGTPRARGSRSARSAPRAGSGSPCRRCSCCERRAGEPEAPARERGRAAGGTSPGGGPTLAADLRQLAASLEAELDGCARGLTMQAQRVAAEAEEACRTLAAGGPGGDAGERDLATQRVCAFWLEHERLRRERAGLPTRGALPRVDWAEERAHNQAAVRAAEAKMSQLAQVRRVLEARRSTSRRRIARCQGGG